MNPLDAVNSILNSNTAPTPTSKYLVCRKCTAQVTISSNVLPPAICIACNQATSFVVMPTQEKAREVQAAMKAELSGKPAEQNPDQPEVTQTPISQEQAESRATPSRAKVKKEVVKPVETAPVAVIPVNPDLKARRMAAIQNLIREKGLNEAEYKECGHGTIHSLGFTQWQDKLPSYSFMEITDTAQSFREALNEARREDGKVTVDVARVGNLSPSLRETSFDGTIVASLKHPTEITSPARVQPDSKVTLFAQVSRSGNLIYRLVKG